MTTYLVTVEDEDNLASKEVLNALYTAGEELPFLLTISPLGRADVSVLEIPRPDGTSPLQLLRSHGHSDRWVISNCAGRLWARGIGWRWSPFGGIDDDRLPVAFQFTLAEAVSCAENLALDDLT